MRVVCFVVFFVVDCNERGFEEYHKTYAYASISTERIKIALNRNDD